MSGLCLDPVHAAQALAGVPCTRESWVACEAVLWERQRQRVKWATPDDPHDTADRPDGTGQLLDTIMRDVAQAETDAAARKGEVTWRLILAEEVRESFAETDPVKLRAELVQVAAVSVKWIEALDRRTADQ